MSSAELDVFGYPLAPGNYSTSDLALQEAMAAGVPPVVLPFGATAHSWSMARPASSRPTRPEYPRALERLAADPDERLRLGRNAREQALAWTRPARRERWAEVFAGLHGACQKRPGSSPPSASRSGATAFVESLGDAAPEFAASLEPPTEEAARRPSRDRSPPPVVASAAAAGPALPPALPGDGYLSVWVGPRARGGRAATRSRPGEFATACEPGCDAPRVARYLGRAAACGRWARASASDEHDNAVRRGRYPRRPGRPSARLRARACTIAYLGASVTAQKDGYRPRLHELISPQPAMTIAPSPQAREPWARSRASS